jgi:c-di-GMP-binding flagellar brake protein YcgR
MFARTLSRLGRWIGLSPKPDGEDRRVWVRHSCSLETSLAQANGTDSERVAARVENISRGGVRLVAQDAFEPGDLLSIELPPSSANSGSTVLACVVHAQARGNSQWALGCSFASELTDEDLQSFHPEQEGSASSDQRAASRFPCQAQARYQSISADEGDLLPAEVVNISASGVAMKLEGGLQVGELINLELRRATKELVVVTLASVVRVQGATKGAQVVGCNFIAELSEQQLVALL